jgi:hypothetical protein
MTQQKCILSGIKSCPLLPVTGTTQVLWSDNIYKGTFEITVSLWNIKQWGTGSLKGGDDQQLL